MQITANKSGSVSAFLPNVKRLPNGGTHRGFVCDAENHITARSRLFRMALIKGGQASVLKELIFNIGF